VADVGPAAWQLTGRPPVPPPLQLTSFTTDSLKWQLVAPKGALAPPPRMAHAAAAIRDKVIHDVESTLP